MRKKKLKIKNRLVYYHHYYAMLHVYLLYTSCSVHVGGDRARTADEQQWWRLAVAVVAAGYRGYNIVLYYIIINAL